VLTERVPSRRARPSAWAPSSAARSTASA
jgi:hypothetical protein